MRRRRMRMRGRRRRIRQTYRKNQGWCSHDTKSSAQFMLHIAAWDPFVHRSWLFFFCFSWMNLSLSLSLSLYPSLSLSLCSASLFFYFISFVVFSFNFLPFFFFLFLVLIGLFCGFSKSNDIDWRKKPEVFVEKKKKHAKHKGKR